MVQVARQVVTKGQIGFDLREPPQDPYSEDYLTKAPDGRYYTKWGLGQSLVEIPFIFVHRLITSVRLPTFIGGGLPGATYHSEWMFLILCPSLISAIGCVLVYGLGRRLGYSERVSMVVSLVYGLCTMVWPYSKSLMSEGTLNVAILGGVYGAVSYAAKRRQGWLLLSGACLGFAGLTKVISLGLVPLVVVYLLVSPDFRTSLRDFCLFFLPLSCSSWESRDGTTRFDMEGFGRPAMTKDGEPWDSLPLFTLDYGALLPVREKAFFFTRPCAFWA